jgi:hypothetical protein
MLGASLISLALPRQTRATVASFDRRLLAPFRVTAQKNAAQLYRVYCKGDISPEEKGGRALAQLPDFANYYGLFFDPGNTTAAGTGILWSLAVEEHFYMIHPPY